MRDLLGVSISEDTVHNAHQAAAQQAGAINRGIDLSSIRVGLHDEIFQGPQPVLGGVATPGRPTAICLLPPNIAMPTLGAFIYWMLRGRV